MPRDADGIACMIRRRQGNAWGWALMRERFLRRAQSGVLCPLRTGSARPIGEGPTEC